MMRPDAVQKGFEALREYDAWRGVSTTDMEDKLADAVLALIYDVADRDPRVADMLAEFLEVAE